MFRDVCDPAKTIIPVVSRVKITLQVTANEKQTEKRKDDNGIKAKGIER